MRNMKWMIAVVLLGGSAAVMGAQTGSTTKDDLFAGTEKFAANASSVTEVDMDPNSLGMVNGNNSGRAKRTVLSVVHTYSYDKPGMYNMADVEAFRTKLNTGDWHCSVHTREMKTGESTDVCQKHRTDDLLESAIITVEPKELTFIHTIRRPSSPSAPGAPGAPPRPGSPESFLVIPGGDFSYAEGVPSAAWTAELRANAAELRAQAAATRAEMAALQPEMMGQMAEMRVNLMPLVRLDGMDGRNLLNEQWVNGLREKLKAMPALPSVPAMPAIPAIPVR